jgi:multimeric flavodoxin WrbA
MRIIAIDASERLGGVSTSVELAAAAAESAGADVERVRLSALTVRTCTGCSMCDLTGTCKIDDDLPALAQRIEEADAVILGTTSYFRQGNEMTAALLDRLAGYFTVDDGQMVLPGLGRSAVPQTQRANSIKRAVIITACAMPEPLATFFGFTTGPVRELRSELGRGGIRTIGSLAVTDTWRHPEVQDWERDKAEALGKVLAGSF